MYKRQVVIGVWFLGALIGDFGILIGGVEFGLWDNQTAADIKSSLGIGLMVGTGIGILVKGIIPKAKDIFGSMFAKNSLGDNFISMRWAPFVMVLLACAFTVVTDMGIIASVSYTHLRAHETGRNLVCRLLLEKKKTGPDSYTHLRDHETRHDIV